MTRPVTLFQAEHISEIVKKVIEKSYSTDKTISFQFKNNRITDEYDRAIIAETSYDLIRWWRLLLEIHNNYPATREVDCYKLLGTWLIINNISPPSHHLFRNLNKEDIQTQYNFFKSFRKISNSIPDWLDQKGFMSYGADWEKELQALNQTPDIYIRVNRLKIKAHELAAKLKAEGFDTTTVDKTPDALKLTNRANIFSSVYAKEGYFEIQDAGSQHIAMYLDARPGLRIADACAGNGGKTLHLACLMQNKGKIIALDNQDDKLKTLKNRATKAGVDIVETRIIEGSKTIKRLYDSFDRLLLDVPCSGSGALKRNPEIKWNMNSDKLLHLQKIQADILNNYSGMLKKGGLLVYATCSILPSENHDQIETFIKNKNGEFELIKHQTLLPSHTGFDGFYMAQIKRN